MRRFSRVCHKGSARNIVKLLGEREAKKRANDQIPGGRKQLFEQSQITLDKVEETNFLTKVSSLEETMQLLTRKISPELVQKIIGFYVVAIPAAGAWFLHFMR